MTARNASTPASSPIERHTFHGTQPGVHLLVLGAIHGNEICGPIAIRRAIEDLSAGRLRLETGAITLIPVANPAAYALGKREADRDLNRNFGPINNPVSETDLSANALVDAMQSADVLLDLHSFKAAGKPFIYLGPENHPGGLERFELAAEELAFAQALGVSRMVDGWLAAYDGFVRAQRDFLRRCPAAVAEHISPARSEFGKGTTEYFRSLGNRFGLTLECGQHQSAEAPLVAYQAIERAISILLKGELDSTTARGFDEAYHFEEVFLREDAGDRLLHLFEPFETVHAGQLLARRASGEALVAPSDGAIIFCYDDEPPGNEWMYFAAKSSRGVRA